MNQNQNPNQGGQQNQQPGKPSRVVADKPGQQSQQRAGRLGNQGGERLPEEATRSGTDKKPRPSGRGFLCQF